VFGQRRKKGFAVGPEAKKKKKKTRHSAKTGPNVHSVYVGELKKKRGRGGGKDNRGEGPKKEAAFTWATRVENMNKKVPLGGGG